MSHDFKYFSTSSTVFQQNLLHHFFLEELIINLDVKKKKLYFPFCLLCTVFIKNKHHKYLKASNVEEVPKVRNV